MSTNLYWKPIPPEPSHNALPRALKYKLGPKLWGHDGTLGSEDTVVGPEIVPYLEGLRDAGTEGAQELIDLIEKHGAVVVWLEG